MVALGEIKIVATGIKLLSKCLPVGGKLTLMMPNGIEIEYDVLDILEVNWYDDVE